jgi:hypothetical protein
MLVRREQELALAREVVEHPGLADPDARGDLPERSLVVSGLAEHLERRLEDRLAGRGGLGVRPARPALLRILGVRDGRHGRVGGAGIRLGAVAGIGLGRADGARL